MKTENTTPAASASRLPNGKTHREHHLRLAAAHLWMAETGRGPAEVPETLPDPEAEIFALRKCSQRLLEYDERVDGQLLCDAIAYARAALASAKGGQS